MGEKALKIQMLDNLLRFTVKENREMGWLAGMGSRIKRFLNQINNSIFTCS